MIYNKEYMKNEMRKIEKLNPGDCHIVFFKNKHQIEFRYKIFNMGGFYRLHYKANNIYVDSFSFSNLDELKGVFKFLIKLNLNLIL